MSTTLTLTGLDVAYGARTLVTGLDLVLSPGDVTALVGPNGSGKSSLMRTIVGELPVESGAVRLAPPTRRSAGCRRSRPTRTSRCSPTPGGVPASPPPTAPCTHASEALAAGRPAPTTVRRRRSSTGSRSAPPTSRTGCRRSPPSSASTSHPDRPLGTLSGGQAARAALASVLLSRYDVLLLDEPTNNLDAHGLALMVDFVTGHDGPVLVASHDRAFLDRVATPVVELDLAQQRIGHYTGGWSDYVAARDLARRQAREAFEEYAGDARPPGRAGTAARGLGREGPPQRGGGRRAGQAHPGEVQGPRRPAGRQGRAAQERGRPARRGRAAAQGVGAALRDRRRPGVRRGGRDRSTGSRWSAATSSSARST